MKKKVTYQWATQSMAQDIQVIELGEYDPNKDFHRDPSGFYVLIRPDFTTLKIEVAICDKTHVVVKVFRGSKAQDVYEGIFRYEKQHGHTWFKEKGHIAYLGKELKKVELALVLGQNNYFQE